MPFGRFLGRSPRAEEPPSPPLNNAVHDNVRSMLNGGGSSVYSQPTVLPSPTNLGSPDETPKLPPLDFVRSQRSSFDFQSSTATDDAQSQTTGGRESLPVDWVQSPGLINGSAQAQAVRSSSIAQPFSARLPPAMLQSYSAAVESPVPAHHPADTAAAEAMADVHPQLLAADLSTRTPAPIAHGYWVAHGDTGGRTVAIGHFHDAHRGIDPETGEMAAMAQRDRHRRQRKRQQGQWVRRRSDRGKTFYFARGRVPRQKCVWLLISGVMLASTLTLYLSLALTQSKLSESLHILFILAILAITMFFCHALIRYIAALIRGPSARDRRHAAFDAERAARRAGIEGFKPTEPIRVHLARDEELEDETSSPATSSDPDRDIEAEAGSEATEKPVRAPPPAYGLWRSSVRVDPNLLHWAPASSVQQAASEAPSPQTSRARHSTSRFSGIASARRMSQGVASPLVSPLSPMPDFRIGEAIAEEQQGADAATPVTDARAPSPRPPSYMSDEGVEYVVAAAPRSTVDFSNVQTRTNLGLP